MSMRKPTIVLLIIILFILIKCFFIEPNSIQIKKYQIKNEYLNGLRIVFLSDFHLRKSDYGRLDKIVQMTKKQNPDIVILGGDFANGHNINDMMDVESMAIKLGSINVPTFAVLGENDWWSDGPKISKALQKENILVLENSSNFRMNKKTGKYDTGFFIPRLRRYVYIVGLADLTTRKPDIKNAINSSSMSQIFGSYNYAQIPKIIVTHNPDVYFDILDNVTLILAGHTHGGQFIIPFTKPLFVPSKYGAEFASGLIEKTKNKMIVSKGLGTSILPVRLGCKPEIVVVDFSK